jgi:hypothetical protein
MSIAAASDLEMAPAPARPLLKPLIAAASVALADWLFYGWEIGISLALFLGVLGGVAVASNGVRATRHTLIGMTVVFIAGLLVVIEDVNLLSVLVGTLATAMFVMVVTARQSARWWQYLLEVLATPFRGPFHLAADLVRVTQQGNYAWLKPASLAGWIVPLGIFTIFVWLFASANPLIEHGLLRIDLWTLINALDPARVAFWVLLAGFIWPLMLRRNRRNSVTSTAASEEVAAAPSEPGLFFGKAAMVRSLILFNALFALQSGLDLVYLWGGASLPDGMSHAQYAHRGAYPLIATALLAAGFVLIAMRPGGPAEHSRLIRPLVLAWIGQNILLVISSIFRLDLYVAAFSLTYLRLAAFIWMGLVAAGLMLILIQILLKKPNSWLVTANAATLALVLYGCCFINAPQVVASYNAEHCREAGGTGPNLDLKYLFSLGPQVLPVLEPRLQHIPALQPYVEGFRFDQAAEAARKGPANWRAGGFRAWRLERYLANNPATPSDLSQGGQG